MPFIWKSLIRTHYKLTWTYWGTMQPIYRRCWSISRPAGCIPPFTPLPHTHTHIHTHHRIAKANANANAKANANSDAVSHNIIIHKYIMPILFYYNSFLFFLCEDWIHASVPSLSNECEDWIHASVPSLSNECEDWIHAFVPSLSNFASPIYKTKLL